MQETEHVPVRIGDYLKIRPLEKAKTDYFMKVDGFIIFLKKVTDAMEGELIEVKVTSIKEHYAFAEYQRNL